MKNTRSIILLSALLLSGCADFDDIVKSTAELVNATEGLFGASKVTPAQICKDLSENPVIAQSRCKSKTIYASGKIINIYDPAFKSLSKHRDSTHIGFKSGAALVSAGMRLLGIKDLKIGQTVKVKGTIDDISKSRGMPCLISLTNSIVEK